MKSLGSITVAALGAAGLLLTAVGPVRAAPTVLPVSSAEVTPLSVGVQMASKSGRFVTTGDALYDTRARKVVKRFPSRAEVLSISDDGRYVSYTLPGPRDRTVLGKPTHKWDYKKRTVKVFDRRTGKTRTATTTRSGHALKPAWRTPCIAGKDTEGPVPCEEGFELEWAPELVGGQISGNGRYTVFCANYATPKRVDLYIKDLRTRKLTIRKGACSAWSGELDQGIQAPSISEAGGTILLPGPRTLDEGGGKWGPSRALINRARVIEIGGYAPTMTHDGKTISVKGAFQNDSYAYDEQPVTWLDLNTGTRTPADPTYLQLTMQNTSRRGRYVTELESPSSVAHPIQLKLTVRDRTEGVTHDLTPALNAAGFSLGDSTVPAPILTGDGKTVFVQTQQGPWVAIRWRL
jgi:hypothetical protein